MDPQWLCCPRFARLPDYPLASLLLRQLRPWWSLLCQVRAKHESTNETTGGEGKSEDAPRRGGLPTLRLPLPLSVQLAAPLPSDTPRPPLKTRSCRAARHKSLQKKKARHKTNTPKKVRLVFQFLASSSSSSFAARSRSLFFWKLPGTFLKSRVVGT